MNLAMVLSMFLSIIVIQTLPELRREVLNILDTVTGPAAVEPGCLGCSVLEEPGDDRKIFYIERWRSEEEMQHHIRSSLYLRVLNALELSSLAPEVEFYEYSGGNGLELIRSLRSMESGHMA